MNYNIKFYVDRAGIVIFDMLKKNLASTFQYAEDRISNVSFIMRSLCNFSKGVS